MEPKTNWEIEKDPLPIFECIKELRWRWTSGNKIALLSSAIHLERLVNENSELREKLSFLEEEKNNNT